MSLALPVFVGPAVPRRNLITLFSWFRFCFLIKKMTLLGSGPAALKGVTFKRSAVPARSSWGRAVGPRWPALPGLALPLGEAGGRGREQLPLLSSCVASRTRSHRSALGAGPSNARWAQGGEDPQGPQLGQG